MDKSKDMNRQTNEFTRTNKQVNKLGPFHKGRIFALCEGTGAKISVILNLYVDRSQICSLEALNYKSKLYPIAFGCVFDQIVKVQHSRGVLHGTVLCLCW